MVDNSALDIRKREVEQKRAVVQRLVHIITYLEKQGLAFCGYRHEAAHALKDDVNHGNFLELVKLVGESDNHLKEHIDRVVGTNGRGCFITFLSYDITTRI